MIECVSVLVFKNKIDLNFTSSVCFEPMTNSLALPFPLYLSFPWRVIIALLFMLTFIEGAKLRLIIVSYINSPESKTGPINKLFWVDQIYGVFFGASLIVRIAFVLSPYSLSLIFGFVLIFF